MLEELHPSKNVALMHKIIKDNKLSEKNDQETIDLLKGSVALSFLRSGAYSEFENYIFSMKNKFNQTSYLNIGVSDLLRSGKNPEYAEKMAKKTLDLFLSYRDDPAARPSDFPKDDWERFMKFAFFPYTDTYASALFANNHYKDALKYQKLAFDSSPENAMTSSLERYAKLLELNGEADSAYNLLLNLAKMGKMTASMNQQLEEIYLKRGGDRSGLERLMDQIAASIQENLKKKFREKALNTEIPDFTLSDLNGLKVSLSDFKGKIVVIDFWATWCLPCKASFPAMIKVMEKHPEVVFLYIATREEGQNPIEEVKNYILKSRLPFYVLMDEPILNDLDNYKALSIFKPSGIPAKAIIDARGVQKFISIGFTSESELINELEAMLSVAKGE